MDVVATGDGSVGLFMLALGTLCLEGIAVMVMGLRDVVHGNMANGVICLAMGAAIAVLLWKVFHTKLWH